MSNFPSPEEILEYINIVLSRGEGAPTRREIAKAFGIKGPDRATLRTVLSQMKDKGLLDIEGKRATPRGKMPPVIVMDVHDSDEEGDLICTPVSGPKSDPPPVIMLSSTQANRTKPPIGMGSRFLGRLTLLEDGSYTVKPIKVIGKSEDLILGVYREHRRNGGILEPVNRKAGASYQVHANDVGHARDGDLVWAIGLPARGYGPRRARIRDVVGDVAESRNWSLIALANNDIPMEFPPDVLAEAAAVGMPDGKYHEDLRHLPLITIDPQEAKDHDDAVHAERVGDDWKITVAIADVSWFVRTGSALDKEAQKRGNSVYLVDRVVPMLPEELSNGLCSLHEAEDRPALCCEMIYDEDGHKKSHRFFRAMIKCTAGISYEEAQAAADGNPNQRIAAIKDSIIDPLYAAYAVLRKERERHPALDLDMPERQILLNKDGSVKGVKTKTRLDAHQLVELMMVAANVCAAETLEQAKRQLIYRVHDVPKEDRVESLGLYLSGLDYSLPKGQVIRTDSFNRILTKARERDQVDMISMAILRTQSQAIYDTDNIGHFGLSLRRYAHFTSPIRRYADLTVHRGLVAACKLGPGGMQSDEEAGLERVAERISDTERRAISAERETQDRFLAAYLERETGSVFSARINGVTSSGMFVTLDETGADGFIPARTLHGDYYIHDENTQSLIGRQHGERYHIGQRVKVELVEVTPVQGGLRFNMLTDPLPPEEGQPRRPAPSKKGKRFERKERSPNSRQSAPKGKPGTHKPTKRTPPKKKNAPDAKKAAHPKPAAGNNGVTLKRRPKKPKP